MFSINLHSQSHNSALIHQHPHHRHRSLPSFPLVRSFHSRTRASSWNRAGRHMTQEHSNVRRAQHTDALERNRNIFHESTPYFPIWSKLQHTRIVRLSFEIGFFKKKHAMTICSTHFLGIHHRIFTALLLSRHSSIFTNLNASTTIEKDRQTRTTV